MIINKDVYKCPNCKKMYFFETSKPYSANCYDCKCGLKYMYNADCDTELAERVKNMPAYDPTKDPKSPFYIPVVSCPYCHSTNTRKISKMSKAGSAAVWGIFAMGRVSKEWHCNSCGSDF